jgi:hypothetical protein
LICFGSRSGALAAKELERSLTAHSVGVGRGATFVLELPMELPRRNVLQNENTLTSSQN